MTNADVHVALQVGAVLALGGALGACGPLSLGSFGLEVDQDASSHASDASTATDAGADANANAVPDADAEPAACDEAACDDADPCNGVFACRDGQCVQVAPACLNPDEAHCEARCEVAGERAECIVSARDGDGDGHGDRACTADALADDCDDAEPSVHAGAAELCDGLDNDCNGKVDLSDTLPLPGENRRLGLGEFPVLASSDQNTFGLVLARYSEVVFRPLKADGSDYLGELVIGPMDPQSAYVVPHLAWGRDSFGAVWSRNGLVRFLEMKVDGQPVHEGANVDFAKQNVSPDEVHASRGRVTPVGEGDWLVFYEDAPRGALDVRRVTAAGDHLEPREVATGRFEQAVSVATLGSEAAALWSRSEGAIDLLEWTVGVEGLGSTPIASRQLAASGSGNGLGAPLLATGPRGYALAWTERGDFAGALATYFMELDERGTLLCPPVEVDALALDGRSALVPTSMVATERGYVLAGFTVRDEVASAEILEVTTRDGCKFNQRASLAERTSRTVAIAQAGSGEFLLVWDQPDAGGYSALFRRSLPARLCAEPLP
jgi:hypothetical protein